MNADNKNTQATVIFENATVVDGTGAPARQASVAVTGERISAVAADFPADLKNSARRVDLSGLTLAPGFVDVHAHGELEPLADNRAAGKVLQGVTTEISGNCGHTPFPLLGALRERFEKEARDEYNWDAASLDWTSADGYFGRLAERRCTINRGFLAGHGSLRAAVNGYGSGAPGADGRRQMARLLEESLEAGCFGLSTGLVYPPGCYGDTEELVALAKICARRGALYTSHMRSESDGLEAAVAETLRICRESGARTQISHLKTSQPRSWHKIAFLEETLLAARRDGLDFHADRYPYIAGSTSLDAVLPRWAYAGGHAEELKRLHDPAICARLEAEITVLDPDPALWTRVGIAGVTDPALRAQIAGRTLADVAAEWQMRPFEAFRRIIIADELRTQAIFYSMSEDNLEKILSWDFVMVGSDATARDISGPTRVAAPHPRTFGTFPRVLATYVRERKLFSLEEAIRKMAVLPAQAFHLKDRGEIRVGAFADLVVFDAARIQDEATYRDPNRFPSGIDSVYVNGTLVVKSGTILESRPGKVLRRTN